MPSFLLFHTPLYAGTLYLSLNRAYHGASVILPIKMIQYKSSELGKVTKTFPEAPRNDKYSDNPESLIRCKLETLPLKGHFNKNLSSQVEIIWIFGWSDNFYMIRINPEIIASMKGHLVTKQSELSTLIKLICKTLFPRNHRTIKLVKTSHVKFL